MSMITNLNGRLRNTPLLKSNALMPLFEAVVNSIHSIEEAGILTSDGKITIEIHRSNQGVLNLNEEGRILSAIAGFKIIDNGIGFNDKNFSSFQTLDTDYKADKGCRGVGRLLWLKAFETVYISSVYEDGTNQKFLRVFNFNQTSGVTEPVITSCNNDKQRQTTVHLSGFISQYQKNSKKTAEAIANSLLEHCLWYFLREGGVPKISIIDNGETICLDNVYEQHMIEAASPEDISVKEQNFKLTHIKLKTSSSKSNIIALCAANRLVKEENINGKIPGLFGKIRDGESEFIYACYVNSEFLNERVRPERTGFDIEEDVKELFADSDISLKEITECVLERIKIYLAKYLEVNKKEIREKIENFVSHKAPKYRPILGRIPEERLNIDPDISDKKLEILLHEELYEIENQVIIEGHDVMKPKEREKEDDYLKRLQEYLDKVEDIKKSDLASYVSHRKVILDILEAAIQKQANGKYVREDLIHKLIMPMGKDSNHLPLDNCNLWLIDERLAFHNYLASDKTLSSMPITGSVETKKPDILALNICDNPILVSEGQKFPLASITVIEIKRPMRDDASKGEDKDPIEQALGYLDRIRQGKVQTASGRPIPNSDSIPGFCYVICDLTETIISRCKLKNLKITSDNLGYFGYNDNFKAYIEVISFDRLVNSAKERNRAFFDKLGLPTT